MEGGAAVRLAIDLIRMPSRVRPARSAPLPEGVSVLLRIASGDKDAQRQAAEWTGRSPRLIKDSAAFFIEQILLAPEADSYRMLGLSPSATNSELRRNMALLLKAMHPDLKQGDRVVFARRVISAWDALKTPERRAAYDATMGDCVREAGTPAKRRSRARTSKQHAVTATNGVILAKEGGYAVALYRPISDSPLRRAFCWLFAGLRP